MSDDGGDPSTTKGVVPVTDASPLIFLSKGDFLQLFQVVNEQVLIPAAVAREIQQRGRDDVTARALEETSWLRIVEVSSVPSVIQSWDLGPGESAVLAFAHGHSDCEAIIDDLAARRCAATLGIPVRGTLGLVLRAKREGKISAARPVVRRLLEAGMYLSEDVIDEALALVGE